MKLKLTLRTQAPQRGLVPDGITCNAVLSACDKGANSTGGAWGMAGVALCISWLFLQGWDDFVGNPHLAGFVFDIRAFIFFDIEYTMCVWAIPCHPGSLHGSGTTCAYTSSTSTISSTFAMLIAMSSTIATTLPTAYYNSSYRLPFLLLLLPLQLALALPGSQASLHLVGDQESPAFTDACVYVCV